jgi:hypothetical protein
MLRRCRRRVPADLYSTAWQEQRRAARRKRDPSAAVHRRDNSRPYAWNTYWGGKLIFKASDANTYVATIPLADATGNPGLDDYANVNNILSVLGELRCSMYENALIPVALANKSVSLSDFPSSRILEKFAKGAIA